MSRTRLRPSFGVVLAVGAVAALPHSFGCSSDPTNEPPRELAAVPVDAGSEVAASTNPDGGTLPDDAAVARSGIAVLGYESHSPSEVEIVEVGGPGDGLNVPRDLAFNPEHEGELWVVNRRDDSTVTYFDVGTPSQRADKRIDPFAFHFMEEVSSIAFGSPGKFGTCQESRNTYNGMGAPNDFMGPSLWPSDMGIYARSNPAAVRALGYDLGSHLDMLHESPFCMGIAWESDNIYWTFDGYSSSISRYNFQVDHGPGWDDHSDGKIERFVEGQVSRVADVPSHLEYDAQSGLLYVADTGNARIAVLNTNEGRPATSLRVKEPGTTMVAMSDISLTTLVSSQQGELMRPSGIALIGEVLYVTDNQNSRISAFSRDGARIDWLDTGLPSGALMGITADPAGRLYIVDAVGNRVLRVAPKR